MNAEIYTRKLFSAIIAPLQFLLHCVLVATLRAVDIAALSICLPSLPRQFSIIRHDE